MKKKEWIPYILALIALIIGAFYDYQITDFFYDQENLIGILFERFLLIPVQLMIVITMCMCKRIYHNRIYLLLGWVASLYMIQDFIHYYVHIDMMVWCMCMLTAVLITALVNYVVMKFSEYTIKQHFRFFMFYTCVLLSAILVTFIIKNIWGRIRYRDMQDAAQFCVWYKPCGLYGNHSFPSGHTTAFTSILCFLQWKTHPLQKVSPFRYIVITACIIFMPVTRMMMGAHFLSDTAAGFMIAYSCYLIYRYQFHMRRSL